jgi:hypothetical protein
MANKIQIKRGLLASIPVLSDGELGYATDQPNRLYIGNGGTNKIIGDGVYAPLTGTGTSGSWPISVTGSAASCTGNAATATTAAACSGNAATATTASACSGNAATATILATARTINGVSFNGSANITVADSTKLPLSGGTLTGALTLSGAPSADAHAATKAYVDGLVQGVKAKSSVKAATTANITLSAPQTVDGSARVAGDRGWVKNQTTTSANGVYIVAAAAWTRATDADVWSELISMFVWVEQGTDNSDSGWLCTIDAGGTLNTTAITFVQFSGAGQITAGTGMTATGNTLNVISSDNGIVANADSLSLTYGTAVNTVCQGNDSRLSDARTPTSHVHGNITNAGAIGTIATLPIITTTSGVLTTGAFGTAAGSFAQGNDSRFHNAVTLGTANGLSLSTQDLSLNAATNAAAGAATAAQITALEAATAAKHTQNTDTGTSNDTFQIGTSGPKIQKTANGVNITDYNGSPAALIAKNLVIGNIVGLDYYTGSITYPTLTANRTWTAPNSDGTFILDTSTIDGGTF